MTKQLIFCKSENKTHVYTQFVWHTHYGHSYVHKTHFTSENESRYVYFTPLLWKSCKREKNEQRELFKGTVGPVPTTFQVLSKKSERVIMISICRSETTNEEVSMDTNDSDEINVDLSPKAEIEVIDNR